MSRKPIRARRRHWHPRHLATPYAPPGMITAATGSPRPAIALIAYGPEGFVETPVSDLQEIGRYLHRWPVTWLNVDGLGDAAMIERIGGLFGLHALALEDVVHVHQRAKVDRFPDHDFIVARMVEFKEGQVESEQISLFLGRDYLLTFQERPGGDPLDALRARLRREGAELRRQGPDSLAHALLDAIVDGYFPALERFGAQLEDLEEAILARPDRRVVPVMHEIRRELLLLRRCLWPLRETAAALAREVSPLIGQEARLYLHDVYDHSVQALDLVEVYRELAAGMMDLYLSAVNNQMNDVMRVLTMIATVFIPLSFVAGVYGMNFDADASPWNMPELRWRWGYLSALAAMGAIGVALVVFFWRKGWLSSLAAPRPGRLTDDPGPHRRD